MKNRPIFVSEINETTALEISLTYFILLLKKYGQSFAV